MLMLLFHLANSHYAIPVTQVLDVTSRVVLDASAGTLEHVAGPFNYRGQHVPVINLHQILQGCSCRDSFTHPHHSRQLPPDNAW